jgi:hypothetical protein
MKIRKIISILIIFSLLLVSFPQAEADQNRIGLTLSDERGEIRLTTSMIPDQPFSISLPEGIESRDLFNLIRPNMLPMVLDSFARAIMERNNEIIVKPQKGFFSGDLFEQAYEKKIIDFTKDDIQLLITDLIGQLQGIDADVKNSLERIMKLFIRQVYEKEKKISISYYDQGHYLTINIGGKQETVLIVSADLSEKNTYRIVIGRGTGNVAYYDEISCKQSGTETDYIFSLYRTTVPTFRMVSEQDCVQFAEIRITDQGDKAFEFEGEIHSVLLPEVAVITGNRPAGEEKVNIEMNIGEREQETTEVLMPILFQLMML